jgi:hypothetical protein
MAIDPEILALVRDGRAARPLDLPAESGERLVLSPILDVSGDTRPPRLWSKRSADGRTGWLAVFAWNEPFATAIDVPPGAFEIVPPASAGAPATRVPVGEERRVEVPARVVRLFVFGD